MKLVEEKAVKLVLERKVTITWQSGDAAQGTVDGHHGTYQVSYSPAGRICTCPAGANHRVCSHGLALELAVQAQRERVEV